MNAHLYLTNGIYIDYKTLHFSNKILKVSKGQKGGIEFVNSIPENSEIFDCKGKYITKSFVNSHHHIYSTLALGMPSPKIIPNNFFEILKYIWWKLDKSLTQEMIEISALISAINSIKNGVTFIIDHHSSPLSISDSLNTIKKSLDNGGVNSLLCYELSDRDGEKYLNEGILETESFLEGGGQGLVGLHASFTVSNKLLKKAVEIAENSKTGIHVHAAEDLIDQEITFKNNGERVIHRLNGAGVLSLSSSILAHCIHIDKDERALLASSNAWIVQNPESNLNNNVGIFSPEKIGDKTLLGTDGMNNNILGSSNIAFFVGNMIGNNTPSDIYERLRNSHKYLQNNEFVGDNDNNLVIFNYNPGTDFNSNNFYTHFVYGMSRLSVDSVISNGEIIMKEKHILTLDEESILKKGKELSSLLWKKMGEVPVNN